MAKQKVVIKVSVKDQKARTKAFKIAVGQSGVDSASIQTEKQQLEVVGDFDPVALATLLRKSLGQAELVSVGSAEKVEEKKDEAPKPQTITISYDPNNPHAFYPPPYYNYYPVQDYQQPTCNIM